MKQFQVDLLTWLHYKEVHETLEVGVIVHFSQMWITNSGWKISSLFPLSIFQALQLRAGQVGWVRCGHWQRQSTKGHGWVEVTPTKTWKVGKIGSFAKIWKFPMTRLSLCRISPSTKCCKSWQGRTVSSRAPCTCWWQPIQRQGGSKDCATSSRQISSFPPARLPFWRYCHIPMTHYQTISISYYLSRSFWMLCNHRGSPSWCLGTFGSFQTWTI